MSKSRNDAEFRLYTVSRSRVVCFWPKISFGRVFIIMRVLFIVGRLVEEMKPKIESLNMCMLNCIIPMPAVQCACEVDSPTLRYNICRRWLTSTDSYVLTSYVIRYLFQLIIRCMHDMEITQLKSPTAISISS